MSLRCPEGVARLLLLLVAFWSTHAATGAPAAIAAEGAVLRVCAHPDNLPYSADNESGFDNKIARVIASELHARLEYTWLQPQHGLVRKTLGAGLCDAIFGLPQGYEAAATTLPYYRSRYVFIYPHGSLAAPPSLEDGRILDRRIGVQLIGDDMAATPPGHALALAHASHVIGFPVYGEAPAVSRMVDAIVRRDIDMGVAWGPAAGYFAAHSGVPLDIAPARAPAALGSMPFEFAIAIGVRKSDGALKDALDRAIAARRADIDAILRAYDVPTIDAPASAALSSCPASQHC